MKKDLKNIAASVHQRLYNKAKEQNRQFNELLQYYAMERFLYRLAESKYKNQMLLKGALMFVVWKAPRSRATRDIDLSGRFPNNLDHLVSMMKEIIGVEVESDGITFDPETLKADHIQKDAEYKGIRILFLGHLGNARIHMQIDFGFGDSIVPPPIDIVYPTILDMPSPKLRGYPPETTIAEKLHAMLERGQANSRLKDYYDIWLLANQFNFDGHILGKAIVATCAKRATPIVAEPIGLSKTFYEDKIRISQWKTLIRKFGLDIAPTELKETVGVVKGFLSPILEKLEKKEPVNLTWKAPGPWSKVGSK